MTVEIAVGTFRPQTRQLPLLSAIRRFWHRAPLAVAGIVVIGIWVLIAITVPLWTHDPNIQDMSAIVQAPSAQHIFGTDTLGRDVFTRVMWSARTSLPVAGVVLLISIAIGGTLGMISGFAGGLVDEFIMRLTDLAMAFPGLILALAIAAALGPSILHLSIAMIIVNWMGFARLMRGQVLAVRELPHVEAARIIGASPFRIAVLHILPETISPLLVLASLGFGSVILTISGLSFLGLGAVPPLAEWGAMVADGENIFVAWWLTYFPALAIMSVVLSANFIGDGLRDILDPRSLAE